jgi:hypothetical protein
MDYCALQCAWISVIVVGLGFIGGGSACWMVRNDGLESGTIAAGSSGDNWLMAGAIILCVISGLYCLCLACNLKSLAVSIRIIETAADFFADTKRVAFVPVLFFFLAILTTFAWLYGYICVMSVGTITADNVAL